MSKFYSAPELTKFGTVASMTAAIGGDAMDDQSDYPQQFTEDGGSYDVCNNDDPNSTC